MLRARREFDRVPGFEEGAFTHGGRSYRTWRAGSGPGVVVMHEVPGITPAVAGFAQRVVDAGFTVVMPELFGTLGRGYDARNVTGQILRACISREFRVMAARRQSPITDFLRALCRDLHAELGGPGVGAVGMCLTGNFALALMVDSSVMAPVLSQPSLPFGVGSRRRAGLHLSDADLAKAQARCRDEGLRVLGLRFTMDALCPAARFHALREAFGDAFEAIEIDSRPRNPHKIPITAHSVLTKDLVDRDGHPTRIALDRTLAFFAEHLR